MYPKSPTDAGELNDDSDDEGFGADGEEGGDLISRMPSAWKKMLAAEATPKAMNSRANKHPGGRDVRAVPGKSASSSSSSGVLAGGRAMSGEAPDRGRAQSISGALQRASGTQIPGGSGPSPLNGYSSGSQANVTPLSAADMISRVAGKAGSGPGGALPALQVHVLAGLDSGSMGRSHADTPTSPSCGTPGYSPIKSPTAAGLAGARPVPPARCLGSESLLPAIGRRSHAGSFMARGTSSGLDDQDHSPGQARAASFSQLPFSDAKARITADQGLLGGGPTSPPPHRQSRAGSQAAAASATAKSRSVSDMGHGPKGPEKDSSAVKRITDALPPLLRRLAHLD